MYFSLTPRETEILGLIVFEYTTSEIAVVLGLSVETIKMHRKHLLNKLGARNVAGPVRHALECEVVALEKEH